MRGKTALILVNDPGFVTGEEALFRKAMTYHGRWTYKYEEAARQGAAAAIIVHDTAPAAVTMPSGTAGPARSSTRTAPTAMAVAARWKAGSTQPRARQLMELAGQDFDALQAAAVSGAASSPCRWASPRPVVCAMPSGACARRMSPARGRARTGPTNTIYVAHWDHLGVAEEPAEDRIYNGAADNATGVAAILAIARGFRNLLPGPSRSVIFMAVTAEESLGLLGSEFYAEKPLVPLEKTAAVINIDALYPIGRVVGDRERAVAEALGEHLAHRAGRLLGGGEQAAREQAEQRAQPTERGDREDPGGERERARHEAGDRAERPWADVEAVAEPQDPAHSEGQQPRRRRDGQQPGRERRERQRGLDRDEGEHAPARAVGQRGSARRHSVPS